MIGEMSYEEMKKAAQDLLHSSEVIRSIATKYESDLSSVVDFCNSLDRYVKFLETNVALYQDSDIALQTMIKKNQ